MNKMNFCVCKFWLCQSQSSLTSRTLRFRCWHSLLVEPARTDIFHLAVLCIVIWYLHLNAAPFSFGSPFLFLPSPAPPEYYFLQFWLNAEGGRVGMGGVGGWETRPQWTWGKTGEEEGQEKRCTAAAVATDKLHLLESWVCELVRAFISPSHHKVIGCKMNLSERLDISNLLRFFFFCWLAP